MKQQYDVVIVGAASLIGREIANRMEEVDFPYNHVYAVDISQYIGNEISLGDSGRVLKIEQVENFDFSLVKIVFFACSPYLTKSYIKKAEDNNCFIFDLSSSSLDDENVPIVLSGHDVDYVHHKSKVVGIPSAQAYMITKVIKNIHDSFGVVSCNIAGYNSVSSYGKEAMDELFSQTKNIFMNQRNEPYILPKKIAFNVIPFSGDINDSGYTDHEEVVIKEIKRNISSDVSINYTAVTVPAFIGVACLVDVELSMGTTIEDIKEVLLDIEDLSIINDESEVIAVSLTDVAHESSIFISRFRMNLDRNNKFTFWLSADNLRKCTSYNAVEVAMSFLNTTGFVN